MDKEKLKIGGIAFMILFCSGYGECSATEPNCFDECQDDSDCGGPIK